MSELIHFTSHREKSVDQSARVITVIINTRLNGDFASKVWEEAKVDAVTRNICKQIQLVLEKHATHGGGVRLQCVRVAV